MNREKKSSAARLTLDKVKDVIRAHYTRECGGLPPRDFECVRSAFDRERRRWAADYRIRCHGVGKPLRLMRVWVSDKRGIVVAEDEMGREGADGVVQP